jgi:hypothetical protein
LIGGRDAAKIRVDVSKLPLDLPRRPGQRTIGLLDISAAVGGAPLRYLLEFFSLKPTIDTLHQTVASGDNESIRMIWGRLETWSIAASRRKLAKTAAEFHFVGVVNWILRGARRRAHEFARGFAVEHRLIDVLLGMKPLPRVEDAPQLFGDSMAAAFEDQLLKWLPDVDTARLVAAHDGRDIASLNAFCDAADGLSKTVVIAVNSNCESICGGYLAPAWREDAWAHDDSKSFLFTLKNHAGVGPTKFPKKGSDSEAAYMSRNYSWHFGYWKARTSTSTRAGTWEVGWAAATRTWSGRARRSSTAARISSGWRAGSSGKSRENVYQSRSTLRRKLSTGRPRARPPDDQS